jgi:hypothetical protein
MDLGILYRPSVAIPSYSEARYSTTADSSVAELISELIEAYKKRHKADGMIIKIA